MQPSADLLDLLDLQCRYAVSRRSCQYIHTKLTPRAFHKLQAREPLHRSLLTPTVEIVAA